MIEIGNLPAVFQKLRDLETKKAKAILRKSINAGTRVIAKEIRAQAPRLSGALAKSIGVKVKIFRGSGVAVGITGPRSKFIKTVGTSRNGKPIFRRPSKTASLVEHGTRHAAPHPFMEPAIQKSADAALEAMAEKAAAELE